MKDASWICPILAVTLTREIVALKVDLLEPCQVANTLRQGACYSGDGIEAKCDVFDHKIQNRIWRQLKDVGWDCPILAVTLTGELVDAQVEHLQPCQVANTFRQPACYSGDGIKAKCDVFDHKTRNRI